MSQIQFVLNYEKRFKRRNKMCVSLPLWHDLNEAGASNQVIYVPRTSILKTTGEIEKENVSTSLEGRASSLSLPHLEWTNRITKTYHMVIRSQQPKGATSKHNPECFCSHSVNQRHSHQTLNNKTFPWPTTWSTNRRKGLRKHVEDTSGVSAALHGFEGNIRREQRRRWRLLRGSRKSRTSAGPELSDVCDLKWNGFSSSCPSSQTKVTRLWICLSDSLSDSLCAWLSRWLCCGATEGQWNQASETKKRRKLHAGRAAHSKDLSDLFPPGFICTDWLGTWFQPPWHRTSPPTHGGLLPPSSSLARSTNAVSVSAR